MANNILATSQHPSNPVSYLAYLINVSLQEHCDLQDHFQKDYQRELATLNDVRTKVVF